jgi:hypothetical protein
MTRLLIVVVFVLSASSASAQQHWSGRVQEILDAFATMHPTWIADDTGPRLAFNQLFVSQVCFELGPSYGMKRADPNRPLSSDTLARSDASGFVGWDWEVNHNGTVERFPPSTDLSGQQFVPVACQNHFDSPPPVPLNPPTPTPTLIDYAHIDQIVRAAVHTEVGAPREPGKEDTLYAQNERIFQDETNQHKAQDDKQNAFIGFMTDGKTITGEIIGVATLLIDHYVFKKTN